jgi:hypothetical protein
MNFSPGKTGKEAFTSLRRLQVDRGAGAGRSGVNLPPIVNDVRPAPQQAHVLLFEHKTTIASGRTPVIA